MPTYWVSADGGPEGPDGNLAFLHRNHCEVTQNAKLFRKPLAVRTQDGKFDRAGKRASSMPRDKLSAYVRAILTQKGFNPAKIPRATSNMRACASTLETWRAHWFFGTVLKTDSMWWDRDYHGGLDSVEGKGETPEGFVQAIMGNQRQQYMKKMKKTTLSGAPPPPETALVNMGGNGDGVHITGVHNSTITLSSADANNACVRDEVGLAVAPDAEEKALLERLEILQLQRCDRVCVCACQVCVYVYVYAFSVCVCVRRIL
jgi:hypothetical protein